MTVLLRRSQGCTGCRCTPPQGREKFFRAN